MKESKYRKSQKRGLGCVTLIIAVLLILFVIGLSSQSGSTESEAENNYDVIVDANQFSRISPEELIEIMGDPEDVEEWTYQSSNGNSYDATTYLYKNNTYEFMVIDDKVVRFTFNDNKFEHEPNVNILELFNIDAGQKIQKTADSPGALRYSMVNDQIADFWLVFDDHSAIYKITYNINYFS